ncbi:hypothetical protein J4440_03465 [Candidatus Woesearchaeota archaeon]|nr:hypothetical protein [Candidatus Woesearchaeota archaeon]
MAKKETTAQVKKNKKWVPILASKEFSNYQIGETYVEDPTKSVGTTVEVNLMFLTNDSKKQSNNVKFKIVEYKENNLFTEFISYELQKAQFKRLSRPGKEKVEDSFSYVTKDNKNVRIKPILITRSKAVNSKLTSIRITTRQLLADIIKKMNYTDLVRDLISGNLQKEIRNRVNKAVPVGSCIIKGFVKLN